jgi:hypothetical protein
MLFLSIFSSLMFGIPAVLALCFILWLCGVDYDPGFQTLYRGVAGLIALGIFGGWWFSEDGPARPGRGIVEKLTKWPSVMAACSPFVKVDTYAGDPRKPIRQGLSYFLTSVLFAICMGFQCTIAVFLLIVIPVVWVIFGADHFGDDFLLMPLRVIFIASDVIFFAIIWCDKNGPPRAGRGLLQSLKRERVLGPMTLDYIPATGAFILRVPRGAGDPQKLIKEHSLSLSIPASSAKEAVLFTSDPNAVASFTGLGTERAKAQLAAIGETGPQ